MLPIGVSRLDGLPAARLAAMSRDALDRTLRHPAELVIATLSDEAIVLGALQRASEVTGEHDGSLPLLRRGSCGAEVRVGPGTLWMQLALERSDTLVACEPSRLLNRYVRPVLRALTRSGALAHYFDRDWISVAKRPVSMVSFAHDSGTGRALVEVVIACTTPFAIRARPTYLGKLPATLAELGVDVDQARLAGAIAKAHSDTYARALADLAPFGATVVDRDEDLRGELAWEATRDEAIGVVAAGRDRAGRMRVGGELMVSRDAIARLESAVTLADGDSSKLDRAVDALAANGVAMLGVRDLRSVRDVIGEALGRAATPAPQ